MPTGTTMPAEVLRGVLEDCTHHLLPEERKGINNFVGEVQMMPLVVLSIAASLKRIADDLHAIRKHGLTTYNGGDV